MRTGERVVWVLALAAMAGWSWGQVPGSVPAERCELQSEGPDYLLTCPVQGSGDWEVFAALGWRSPQECTLIHVTGTKTRVYAGGQAVGARCYDLPERNRQAGGELRVLRRGSELVVSLDGRMRARALLEGDLSGQAGVWAGRGAQVGEVTLQPLGEVSFDEDFFEREQVPNRWETVRGAWQVGVYYDPLQERENFAPGACWYEAGAGECLTRAGDWFWDSYRAEVTVRLTQGQAGVAVHVGDEGTGRALVVGEDGARLLVRAAGGWKQVGRRAWRMRPGQWYRLALEALPGNLVGYINGEEVLRSKVEDEAETGGVGLLALDAAGSQFDDVRVRGLRGVAGAAEDVSGWTWRGGQWQAEGGVLQGRTQGGQVAALRAGAWTDCAVQARVETTRGATAGLVTHHEFGERGYLYTITAGNRPTWHLHAVAGGKTEKLGEGPAPMSGGLMELRWLGGHLECWLNGQRLFETWDFRAAPGRAGVYVGGGAARFSEFVCRDLERAPERAVCEDDGTGAKVPALEEKVFLPKIGGLWRQVKGTWSSGNTAAGPTITGSVSGGEARLRFHEITPGNPRVVAEVLTPRRGGEIGLAVCAGSGEGYRLRVRPQAKVASLERQGTTVLTTDGVELAEEVDRIELLRAGAWVVARLGAWQGLAYRDPEPLPSGYAEVVAERETVRLSRLILTSEGALIYPFNQPEPDWSPETGQWSEHTGMACILWDYWLSGDGRQEPALIWNRHRLGDDVTVDFEVSEYTEGYADGAHRHFPYHDVRVVVSGQEGQAESGYAFVIGAEGGRRTVLLRNGVEVASSSDPRFRISMGSHCNSPRAVQVRATRHGGRLSLMLTGRVALEWEDREPLPAGQVGLGVAGCRANFRDCVIYPDWTWES